MAMRIAALPMYDLPELEAANDALWAAIAERLVAQGLEDTPDRLTRGGPRLKRSGPTPSCCWPRPAATRWSRPWGNACASLRRRGIALKVATAPFIVALSSCGRATPRETSPACAAAVRASLLLDGFEVLPQEAYAMILALEQDAIVQGYPILA